MKTSYIICIIAIAAVLVFFLLNQFFPTAPSWLVFIAAGLGIVIVQGVKSKNKGSGGGGAA